MCWSLCPFPNLLFIHWGIALSEERYLLAILSKKSLEQQVKQSGQMHNPLGHLLLSLESIIPSLQLKQWLIAEFNLQMQQNSD